MKPFKRRDVIRDKYNSLNAQGVGGGPRTAKVAVVNGIESAPEDKFATSNVVHGLASWIEGNGSKTAKNGRRLSKVLNLIAVEKGGNEGC